MANVALIDLLLRVTSADPDDLMAWRIEGRPPTADELRLLHRLRIEEAQALRSLLELDVDVDAAFDLHLGDG